MQVDIAVDCARMQHRFTMPPLEVEDFPQVGVSELKMQPQPCGVSVSRNINEADVLLQEILSVAHASQELTNPSNYSHHSWGTTSTTTATANQQQQDDFSFMVGRDGNNYYTHPSWEDPINTRSIEIGDLDDDFRADRMAENLRWVGMSSKDLEIKVYTYICFC